MKPVGAVLYQCFYLFLAGSTKMDHDNIHPPFFWGRFSHFSYLCTECGPRSRISIL